MFELAMFATLATLIDFGHLAGVLDPIQRVPALMFFLIPIGVMLGAAYYFWEAIKELFGKIPFVGDMF